MTNADYLSRSGHQFAQPASSNKKRRFNGRQNNGDARINAPAPQRNTGQARTSSFQTRTSAGRVAAPPATSNARGPKHNPLAIPLQTPTARLAGPQQPPAPPRNQRQLTLPIPDTAVDSNASLQLDLRGVLFRTFVRFLSRDTDPAVPAFILLSPRSRPELGLFTVVISNRARYQWPLSAWYDYSTGADRSLGVTFQDRTGFQGYQLYFNNDSDLSMFLSRIQSFLRGEFSNQLETASPLPPAAASVSAANPAEVAVVRLPDPEPVVSQAMPPAINGSVAPVPTIGSVHSPNEPVDGSGQENVPAVDTPVEQVNESDQDTLIGPDTDETPAEQADESDQSTLITLDADEPGTVTLETPSEAAELLSTLEPYDYTEATSAELSRDDIIATARVLLEWFLDSNLTGRTAGELVETVEGIRAGVLQHIAANARAQGLGDRRIDELMRVVNDIFEDKIKERRAALEAARARRIQYTADEMLAMRDAAASPPDWLAEIPYLPRPGSRPRQTSDSTQAQLSRSASAMQWALGGTSSSNPEQASQPETPTAQTVVPGAARPVVAEDSGLQSSRWASAAPHRQHANFFTGPRYEKAWARRTYLEDLAELDPQTKVDAGPEELLDFYFPMSNDGEVPVGPAEPQTSVDQRITAPTPFGIEPREPQTPAHQDNQVPNSSGADSRAATTSTPDKIESLSNRMSRLSIWSPTVAPSQHGGFSARPSSSVIQASQELRAAQSASASTQPPRAAAAQATPLQSMAPPQSTSASSARSTALPAGQSGQRSLHATPSLPTQPSVPTAAQAPRREQVQTRPAMSQAAASVQPATSAQSAASARPAATQAARPGPRGLGASRHSAGAAPSSAGKFNFHLPPSARK